MKTLLITATALSGLLVPALSAPAEAQAYRNAPTSYEQCIQEQRQRQVAGAVIGGVLGAVIGAEIHDERQDRRRHRDYGYYDPYDRYGHYDRYDRYDRYHHRDEDENDGAVIAGGAVGALAGAAVASGNCDELRYGHQARHDPYARGHDRHDPYRQTRRYGSEPRYGHDPYAAGDPYGEAPYGENRRYSTRDDELLGGPGYENYERDERYRAREYSTAPGVVTAGADYGTGPCRYMSSGNRRTYMCQGRDGIWRPAE